MESLSAVDAGFLYVENECNHMEIAAIAIFEGPPPAQSEIEVMVASKLDRLPRYRQRVRALPLDLMEPYWVDAKDFDLAYHLRRTALPAPGSTVELQNLVGRLMSQKLDHARPLWEMWVIEHLCDDRWAIFCKTHHCLADGVSGAMLLATMLEATPNVAPATASTWVPERGPRTRELIASALRRGWRMPSESLRGLHRAASAPRRALDELSAFAEGLQQFGRAASDSLDSSLNGPIGPHRRWRTCSVSLSKLAEIRAVHGGTVNDVVLASIAAGFRRLLQSRGEDFDGRVLKTLVPVSLHRGDEEGGPGNHVSALVVTLPIGDAAPPDRLRRIRAETSRLKRSHQSEAAETLTAIAETSPPALLSLGAGFLSDVEQHAIQTVATNVRGPGFPLYALGRRLLSVLPFVPIWGSIRIAVAVFSYDGELAFGVTGDYESASDIDVLVGGIKAELEALLKSG